MFIQWNNLQTAKVNKSTVFTGNNMTESHIHKVEQEKQTKECILPIVKTQK